MDVVAKVPARSEETPARAGSLDGLKRSVILNIEKEGGRHDEAEIYDGPSGDVGLVGGPGSISWEVHGDLATIAVAGVGAVLMEVLHPSVMAGVFSQSSYRTASLRRARNTLGYVLRTTFGNTAAATRVVESVKRIHSRVEGNRPDGVAYRALDPALIAWVHTCIPWALMTSYDRYRRPLTTDEKNRYLGEQAVIGRMGGAEWVPETVAELEDYVAHVRPLLTVNEQTRAFIDFLLGRGDDLQLDRGVRIDRWLTLHGAMQLMPEWARLMTRTEPSNVVRDVVVLPAARLRARVVRWAYPELPCKAMALARVQGKVDTGRSASVDFVPLE